MRKERASACKLSSDLQQGGAIKFFSRLGTILFCEIGTEFGSNLLVIHLEASVAMSMTRVWILCFQNSLKGKLNAIFTKLFPFQKS